MLGCAAIAALALQACATVEPKLPPAARAGASYKVGKPYQVGGVWYVPKEQPGYDEKGIASWYGPGFHMKATASGELFDQDMPSAAHTTLPLPSIVEVTNLENGRRLNVRVNDRGPFVGDRIIDLSKEAARQLDFDRKGLARVRVRYVGRGDLPTDRPAGRQYAQVAPAPAAPAPVYVAAAAPIVPLWPPAEEVVATPAPAPIAVADLAPPPAPFRVQAAAFSDPVNAERAVVRLSPEGSAAIEPLERDGVILYRVVVESGADELEAEALRERVAAIGFTDARVIRPF
jgi:rare lipoprotein A